MASKVIIQPGSQWKKVKFDPELIAKNTFNDLISFEECSSYSVTNESANPVQASKVISSKNKKKKLKTKKKSKLKLKEQTKEVSDSTSDQSLDEDPIPRLKHDRKKSKSKIGKIVKTVDVVHLCDKVDEADNTTRKISHKRKSMCKLTKGKTAKMQKLDNQDIQEEDSPKQKKTIDMKAWNDLCLPPLVLKGLEEQGFIAPTSIQMMALPPAIKGKKDIIGAAQTGSGKTLAFGLSILSHILHYKKLEKEKEDAKDSDEEDTSDEENMEEEDLDDESINDAAIMKKDEDFESDEDIEDITDWSMNIDNETIASGDEYDLPPVEEDLENLEEGGIGCVYVENDVKFDWLEEETSKKSTDTDRPLYALILTPTRELAIQIKDHIDNAAKYTGIKTAVVVGGMAQQKQERILKKCPEIVIATPGRLWELIEQKNPHLSKISSIRQLVIDEADRMVEKGHFAELEQILGMINSDPEKKKLRQTYVFSATLTLIHSGPDRVILKKKKKFKMTEEMKLGSLIEQVGLKEKPKIIDLSNKGATADQLTEARINCSASEKDLYVYYLLKQYPGRTLLFTNSKDCLRRVNNIFSLLQCCPLAIHADMHQRQRLKNLDRFKGNPRGFLLATDVAARGLDIPGVQHVIHYQVPRTTENYVHRSGRTARADKEGLSVMLVAPDDVKNYRKIIKTLNRDEDLPSFPVEPECIPALKMRLNLALEIDKVDHRESKLKMQNSWFERAAKEMDVEIDEKMLLHDMGDSFDQAKHKQKLALLRTQLKRLLHEPLALRGKSGKYPTKSGQLVVPFYTANVNASALECMKSTTKPVETTITASKKSKKKFKRRFKNKSNMQNSN